MTLVSPAKRAEKDQERRGHDRSHGHDAADTLRVAAECRLRAGHLRCEGRADNFTPSMSGDRELSPPPPRRSVNRWRVPRPYRLVSASHRAFQRPMSWTDTRANPARRSIVV